MVQSVPVRIWQFLGAVAVLTVLFVLGVRIIPKHPRLFGPLQWFFNLLPGITGYFFAMAGVALLFMQDDLERLKERRGARLAIAALIFLMGLGAVVSDSAQKTQDRNEAKSERDKAAKEREDLTRQVLTLISSAQVQATKDDLRDLGKTMATGFDRVVAAIKGKTGATGSTGAEAPQVPAQTAPVPTVAQTRMVQRSATSDDPKFPYGLEVIVQSNVAMNVAFAFECSGEVGRVKFFIAGENVYQNVNVGPSVDNKNIAVLKFSSPTLKPEKPLVVTILSEHEIRVVRAFRLNP
jgi:hypothetical protein